MLQLILGFREISALVLLVVIICQRGTQGTNISQGKLELAIAT